MAMIKLERQSEKKLEVNALRTAALELVNVPESTAPARIREELTYRKTVKVEGKEIDVVIPMHLDMNVLPVQEGDKNTYGKKFLRGKLWCMDKLGKEHALGVYAALCDFKDESQWLSLCKVPGKYLVDDEYRRIDLMLMTALKKIVLGLFGKAEFVDGAVKVGDLQSTATVGSVGAYDRVQHVGPNGCDDYRIDGESEVVKSKIENGIRIYRICANCVKRHDCEVRVELSKNVKIVNVNR